MNTWGIYSAEQRAKEAAEHFRIPCLEARERLVPEDLARLIFFQNDPPAWEMLWVKVDKITGNGEYSGTLITRPEKMAAPQPGTTIFFLAKNICDISKPQYNDLTGQRGFA